MLSNLASYLGYAATSGGTATEEAGLQQAQVRLRAVEDDDWVLVERSESAPSGEDEPSSRVGRHPVGKGSGAPLQESWYLTPPPSFSSEGPIHMETSPLENLLIEHPSMSVYQRRSDPNSTASDEDSPRVVLPRKEKLSKLPRNKLNAKYSKKRPPTSSSDEAVSLHSASEDETKEPKMKNFVKSPRRSINTELKSLVRKTSRRRAEVSSSDEMKSIPSNNEDEVIVPQVRKKLYSEVLATKPPARVQPELAKPTSVPEAKTETSPVPAPSPAEVLAPAVAPEAETEVPSAAVVVRDRRAAQTIPDHQNRLHFLNRSAQKTEQRKTCDVMKRNPLVRTNKARELNSRNKRQRRADMMQRHSGANNNRKC